jgi:hypothetical protein
MRQRDAPASLMASADVARAAERIAAAKGGG